MLTCPGKTYWKHTLWYWRMEIDRTKTSKNNKSKSRITNIVQKTAARYCMVLYPCSIKTREVLGNVMISFQCFRYFAIFALASFHAICGKQRRLNIWGQVSSYAGHTETVGEAFTHNHNQSSTKQTQCMVEVYIWNNAESNIIVRHEGGGKIGPQCNQPHNGSRAPQPLFPTIRTPFRNRHKMLETE